MVHELSKLINLTLHCLQDACMQEAQHQQERERERERENLRGIETAGKELGI